MHRRQFIEFVKDQSNNRKKQSFALCTYDFELCTVIKKLVNMSTASKSTNELNYSEKVIDQLEGLFLSSYLSDVTFVVDGFEIPAHKLILRLRSLYFQRMFDGGFSESSKSKIDLEVPLEAFKHILRYLYTGRVAFGTMTLETIIDFLSLSQQYCIDELKPAVVSHLMENLSLENCCVVFNAAHSFDLENLKEATLKFFDENTYEILKEDYFKTLKKELLCSLLQRDSFFAQEVDIFRAVLEWRKHNHVSDDDFQMIVSAIRFELIDFEELFTDVRESSILSETRFLDVLRTKTTGSNMNWRALCYSGVNVATAEFNAKTIKGQQPLELLNGNFTNYDGSNGYTSHTIRGIDEDCIMIELGHVFAINQLKMLLWNKDKRSYFYYVEVSTDQKQWTRVIDRTKHACRSWQFLYFNAQPVRYIKVVGTHNTENSAFHVVHLAAYYFNNVAALDKGAKVIQGIGASNSNPDVVLDGDVLNYTGTTGYTYHKLQETPIEIQLAQPYCVGSVRLLLWDGDDRTYGFYIETSTDRINWEMAVDKRDERLQSWQEFSFEPRNVAFFKITGTFNSQNDNNCFHLVHFEAHSTNIQNLKE